METTRFARLLAGLLALSGTALAQSPSRNADSALTASGAVLPAATPAERPVLGGPPQPLATAEPSEPANLARLRQLPLLTAGQPAQLPPAELARLFPQCVHQLASFRPDIAALAKAAAVPGSHGLVALTCALGAAGVPAGGATPGQRLKLLTASGELLVAVARPAAAGSCSLVVGKAPGLAGQTVFVVGLEHPAEQAPDYEALTLLGLSTTQQLAQELRAMQQQLAALRSQLAATQKLNGELLLDQAKQEDLRQQLNMLQSQLAAYSNGRPRRGAGWLAD